MHNRAKQVFAVLPNVDELWFTEDGHHHLHPYSGGEKITREDLKAHDELKKAEPKAVKK